MTCISGEEEVGIPDGWEINEDNEIEVNYFTGLAVYRNGIFIELTIPELGRIIKRLEKLFTLNY
jgi:hypothetical protein